MGRTSGTQITSAGGKTMKRIIIIAGLMLAAVGARADFYSLQHQSVVSDTTNIKIDWNYRGDFNIMHDTYTVYLASMTPVIVLYGTGTVQAIDFVGDGSKLTGVVPSTTTLDNLGNHIATTTVDVNGYNVVNVTSFTAKNDKIYIGTHTAFMGQLLVGTTTLRSVGINVGSSGTVHGLDSTDDVYIKGDLEAQGNQYIDGTLYLKNGLSFYYPDFSDYYGILKPKADAGMEFLLRPDDGYTNYNLIIGNRNFDYNVAPHTTPSTNPTLIIHSKYDPSVAPLQFGSLQHDTTNFVISSSSGVVKFSTSTYTTGYSSATVFWGSGAGLHDVEKKQTRNISVCVTSSTVSGIPLKMFSYNITITSAVFTVDTGTATLSVLYRSSTAPFSGGSTNITASTFSVAPAAMWGCPTGLTTTSLTANNAIILNISGQYGNPTIWGHVDYTID